jgi:hypothetical protein
MSLWRGTGPTFLPVLLFYHVRKYNRQLLTVIKVHIREVGSGLNSTGSGEGPMAVCCEHGNESLLTTKGV